LAHLLSDDDLRMHFRSLSQYYGLAGYSFAPYVIMTRFNAASSRAMCMVHDSLAGKHFTLSKNGRGMIRCITKPHLLSKKRVRAALLGSCAL
jgi:hypothetical protein